MKKKLVTLLLAICIILGISAPALGAWEDFTDVSGHWAEEFLKVAVEDGIVKGYENNTIRPDDPIKVSEMTAAINRVLLPEGQADISAASDVTEETWYYTDAAKAVNLGFLKYSGGDLNIDRPATRQEIFIMMAEAFGLGQAEPDESCLEKFSDISGMSAEGRRAAASLINRGMVNGFGASLYPEANIKRAEFLTLLYRAAYYHPAYSESVSGLDNSAAYPSDGSASVMLSGVTADKDIVLTCPVKSVTINGVNTTARIVVRSEDLQSFAMYGSCSIAELVMANKTGSVSVSPYGGAHVDKLVVVEGEGAVSISGDVSAVELTGSGRTANITSGYTKTLVISGSDCVVTVGYGTNLDSVVITENAKNVQLIMNGNVDTLTVKGENAAVSGSGRAETVKAEFAAQGLELTLANGEFIDGVDHGLEGISITLSAPEKVTAGGKLTVEAVISGVNVEKVCKLEWAENGRGTGAADYTIKEGAIVSRSPAITWSRNMGETFNVGLKITYKGEALYEQVNVPVENYSSEYWDEYEAKLAQEASKNVSCDYKGNFTLNYALKNDYSADIKTYFVNGKGYTSGTGYLIWVNRAYQHVNVFTGSKGNWKLDKSFVCGTGAMSSQTPVGVYKTTYKQIGWFTPGYTVKPVVRFLSGSGYAFHSQLYYPGTDTLSDSRIGFPISHGCVRMYMNDVQWLYDYIPTGTTVVVY